MLRWLKNDSHTGGYVMVKAVVGANWGDEGKGKITDMLAKQADIIVRFQGGANAGHTIINDYGKFALHTLPSGVFYNHTTSVDVYKRQGQMYPLRKMYPQLPVWSNRNKELHGTGY